jgi:hypothetical protein
MSRPGSPQDVTLLYWGEQRRTELVPLLGQEHQLSVISSPAALATGEQSVDVLVVDVPKLIRRGFCEQVRRHYQGWLVVLLDPGDSSHDLPPDHNRMLLTRPFSGQELLAALAGSAPLQHSSDPADDPRTVVPERAQRTKVSSRLGRGRSLVAHAVARLVGGWRERRLVRVSAIPLIAALLFAVAFMLVQVAGCGAACDELTGADRTSPSTADAPVGAWPATPASSAAEAGSTTTDPSVGSTTDAGSWVDGVTGGTPRIAGTTVASSGGPDPTSPPAPTRPQPTTAPTTTSPKSSAPTTTATTTNTTTTTTTAPGP